MKQDLSEILKSRKLIFQHSGTSLEKLMPKISGVYHGIDPTADSLHVGHLVSLVLARWFVKSGYPMYILLGGATGTIGDPSGKKTERQLLNAEEIHQNGLRLKQQITHIFEAENFTIINNRDWLDSMPLLIFLRDIGKFFSLNEMIRKESVRERIDNPNASITYTEFSYSLLQASDFLHLFKHHQCNLQIGGSDQWGNITAGIELIRKKENGEAHGITTPLLIDESTGRKFGKTEDGTIWLDPEKTRPYLFYQFWFQCNDDIVIDLLYKLTDLPMEEIHVLETSLAENPTLREPQKKLAYAMTTLVHGEQEARNSRRISEILFDPSIQLSELSSDDIELLRNKAVTIPCESGLSITELMVRQKIVPSKREARELINAGAIVFNGKIITDEHFVLSKDSFVRGVALLRRGKRDVFVLIL